MKQSIIDSITKSLKNITDFSDTKLNMDPNHIIKLSDEIIKRWGDVFKFLWNEEKWDEDFNYDIDDIVEKYYPELDGCEISYDVNVMITETINNLFK
jgi:hypothetical protein